MLAWAGIQVETVPEIASRVENAALTEQLREQRARVAAQGAEEAQVEQKEGEAAEDALDEPEDVDQLLLDSPRSGEETMSA